MHHYNYSLHEIESLLPWEKEVYIVLLTEHLKEEQKKNEARKLR
jgi:hypothetical protein